MPAESSSTPSTPAAPFFASSLKCSKCGSADQNGNLDGIVVLGDQVQRFCAACVNQYCGGEDADGVRLVGLDLSGVGVVNSSDRIIHLGPGDCTSPLPVVLDLASMTRLHDALDTNVQSPPLESRTESKPELSAEARRSPSPAASSSSSSVHEGASVPPIGIPASPTRDPLDNQQQQSRSLPTFRPAPWASFSSARASSSTTAQVAPKTPVDLERAPERAPNPLLDVTSLRCRPSSYGCLYPGSVFRGSQKSGRSSYEVEIEIVDVNLAEYTACGYLSISQLTDTHPHLTTFFDAEIIGPKFGFITGERFGASEHDDQRHWGRFEQYRRPATRSDIFRPEMLLRDPLPDTARGEVVSRERDFVFLRIKEKFLVPDHHVRDISGASFAGFYYAMIDLSPTVQIDIPPPSPVISRSPIARRQSSSTTPRPDAPRRPSSTGVPRSDSTRRASVAGTTTAATTAATETPPRLSARRQSSSRAVPTTKLATMRGYYFHSLNPEPFQELSLTHVPGDNSFGTFELR